MDMKDIGQVIREAFGFNFPFLSVGFIMSVYNS
jgi:hypothetical protein